MKRQQRSNQKAQKQKALSRQSSKSPEVVGEESETERQETPAAADLGVELRERDTAQSPWETGDCEDDEELSSEEDDSDDEARSLEDRRGVGLAHGSHTAGAFDSLSGAPPDVWSVRSALSAEASRAQWMGQLGPLAARCMETCGPLMSARDVGVAVIAANTVEVRRGLSLMGSLAC